MFHVVIKSNFRVVGGRLILRRGLSTPSSTPTQTLTSLTDDGIFTVSMNQSKTLNAWTEPMLNELKSHFDRVAIDNDIKVMILTGVGRYYCAGVNLSGLIKPMHPKKLHDIIRSRNQQLFDLFLDCQKPIIAAVNGPAIGASVTSAALCDAVIATNDATFSTPFARLGVPLEGCSSVHFARIFGQDNADRMTGPEGWVPTAKEAMKLGLVHSVVKEDENDKDHAALLKESQDLARQWINGGKPRQIGPVKGGPDVVQEYKLVNARESIQLADCVFEAKFLEGQRVFLSSRGKTGPAMMFALLKWTRPVWSLMLPPKGEQ